MLVSCMIVFVVTVLYYDYDLVMLGSLHSIQLVLIDLQDGVN